MKYIVRIKKNPDSPSAKSAGYELCSVCMQN